MSLDPERYVRQIVMPEIGGRGQAKLGRASLDVHGDPSIVEIAATYLRAAGVASVSTREDGSILPGAASVLIGDRRIRAHAGRKGPSVGIGELAPPSPLATESQLEAAGMMLAIESMKAIVGMEPAACWTIPWEA